MIRKNPFNDIYCSPECRFPYKYELPAFPLFLDLEITNVCNLDCLMCGRQIMKRKIGFMEFGLFKRIIDEARKEGCKGIRFIRYGEPFLHKDIFKMIAYVKEKNMSTHITTNGTFSEGVLKKIPDSELDSIIFSFQGTTPEEYKKMRNTNKYGVLIDNIKKLVAARGENEKPFIQINTTLLDEGKMEVSNFIERWSKIADKVDYWYTSFTWLEQVERLKPILERERINISSGRCTEVRTKLSINWDGLVTACCQDFDNGLIVGDLNINTLKEIWNGEKMTRLRNVLAAGKRNEIPFCRKCRSKFMESQ